MTVKEFVEGFKKSAQKEKYMSSHIINTYIPWEKKVDVCEAIVKATTHIEIDGHKKYCINSPAQYVLYSLKMIKLYTDIEIDESANVLTIFNFLDKEGVFDVLLQVLPESEMTKMDTIFKMVQKDNYDNERNISSVIEDIFSVLSKQ